MYGRRSWVYDYMPVLRTAWNDYVNVTSLFKHLTRLVILIVRFLIYKKLSCILWRKQLLYRRTRLLCRLLCFQYDMVSRSDDAAASTYRVTGAFCPDRRTGGRKHRDVRRPVAHTIFVRMRLPRHLFISSFFQSQNEPVVGQYVAWTEWISVSR